jgi:stress-induced morphogen
MCGTILKALNSALRLASIQLMDNSSKLVGHAGGGWEDGKSHFSLDAFDRLSLVGRHKLIHALLGEVMPRIHALAILVRTPTQVEW